MRLKNGLGEELRKQGRSGVPRGALPQDSVGGGVAGDGKTQCICTGIGDLE